MDVELELKGTRWHCPTPDCGWGYDVPQRLLDVDQYLKRIKELEFFLSEFIEGAGSEADYIRDAKRLMDNALTSPPRI